MKHINGISEKFFCGKFFREYIKIFSAILLVFLLLTATGCAYGSVQDNSKGYSFTDSLGNSVTVTSSPKAAFCSGSLAEIWLLAGGELSAVTSDAYDDHLFDVPETAVNIGKMKSPSIEQMIEMGIDFVVLSSEIAEHTTLKGMFENAGITAAYFRVESFDEYLSTLKVFTEITGRSDLYEENGIKIREQVDGIIASVSEYPAPSVLYLRASSTAVHAKGSGSLTGGMLNDLGCVNIADSGELTENLSLEVIVKADPDFIFVTFMGSDEEKSMETLENTLLNNPVWSELSAVKNEKFIILPKNLFHYKPNAKWGEAYSVLSEILYEKK